MATNTEHIHDDILSRLDGVRRKRDAVRLVRGLLLTVAAGLGVVLAAVAAEEVLYLSSTIRTILFWLVAVVLGSLLVGRVSIPLLRLLRVIRGEDDIDTARWVGTAFPALGDRLVNILQLFRERDESIYASPALVEAAFKDIGEQVAPFDFSSAVHARSWRRIGRVAISVVGAGVVVMLLAPAAFVGSMNRLWNYGEAFASPQPFTFRVEPGDREVVKGESVTVIVHADGAAPDQIVLRSRREGESVSEEEHLNRDSDGSFRHEFADLRATTTYGVSAGRVSSAGYVLRVVDRPTITRLMIGLTYPSYTGLATVRLDDNVGDINALVGTRAEVTVEANKDLADAVVLFSDSSAVLLRPHGARASGSFVVRRNGSYHIRLLDRQGTANADPVEYTIHPLPDGFPTASILVPGRNMDVTDNTALPLLIKIVDDFGFTRLRLAYRLVQSRFEQPSDHPAFVDIPLPHNPGVEALVSYTWDLKPLSLVPEDVVSYYVEVFDNDRVGGPKSAVSETYTLRLPSLEEVTQNIDQSHETTLEGMKKALDDLHEMHKDMDDLQQELRREQPKLDWQNQKKGEELARKYDEIQKSMAELNSTVDKMLDEMQKNQVLSKETLEKYNELQHLMAQLNSPEMAEALKKLQQAMQQMNPEAAKQALERLNFSEENFRKSIERTINLIKRLQIEAKLDELTKRADDLQKQENDLREQTAKMRPDDAKGVQDIQRRQKGVKNDLTQVEKELSEMQKGMEEFPKEMPLAEMKNLQDSLAMSGLDRQMDQAQEELSKQDMGAAAGSQEQATQSLQNMVRQMRSVKAAMQRNQQQQIVNEMRRATEDLLELSRRQEELKDDTRGLDPNARQFRDNAQSQSEILHDLGSVTDRMSGLADKSFGVTPEMGQAIGDAMREMGSALQALEQRNGAGAEQQQGQAMGSLNEAAQMLEQAMQGMLQSGGQGMMGMSGFLERLRRLSEQQQGINEGTKGLGKLTPEQAAEMGRLAGEQGMVRKSLEELQREAAAAGQLSRMLGDLRSIAREMREVQTDLAQGSVNPETLRKEDRILSRLLESQRSMNERDFENRRRAEAGKLHPGAAPPALDLTTQEGRNRLRQDLLKALQEGYARDYEDLIRRYFDAIQQQEQQPVH